MRSAKFVYKCRACGELDYNPYTAEDNAYLILLAVVFNLPLPPKIRIGTKPDMLGIHRCNADQVGVSDLIGYEVYE